MTKAIFYSLSSSPTTTVFLSLDIFFIFVSVSISTTVIDPMQALDLAFHITGTEVMHVHEFDRVGQGFKALGFIDSRARAAALRLALAAKVVNELCVLSLCDNIASINDVGDEFHATLFNEKGAELLQLVVVGIALLFGRSLLCSR